MVTASPVARRSCLVLALLTSLALIGCGKSSSDADTSSLVPDSSAPTDQTTPTGTAPNDSSVAATLAPDSSNPPMVTPAPGATLADPPVSSVQPIITLLPGVTFASFPTITSFAVKTSWSCMEATAAGFVITVSWTTTGSDHILIGGPGLKQLVNDQANGQRNFPLKCGTSFNIKVAAVAADGAQSALKQAAVTVGSLITVPFTIQP